MRNANFRFPSAPQKRGPLKLSIICRRYSDDRNDFLRALLCIFHLRPREIEKSKTANFCDDKGLPKPLSEKNMFRCLVRTVAAFCEVGL